jgi:hypothetical protein
MPARLPAGAPAVAPTVSRLIGPLAPVARSLPLEPGHAPWPLAALGPGGGNGPRLLGRQTGLSASAAAPLAQPAPMPLSLGHAGLALGSVFGSEAGSGSSAAAQIASPRGVAGTGPPGAGPLGASRASPPVPAPGMSPRRAVQSAAAALSALLDSLAGGSGIAGAAGVSVAIALMLAALLLHGPPSITRSLLLTRSRSPTLAFALLPERPG